MIGFHFFSPDHYYGPLQWISFEAKLFQNLTNKRALQPFGFVAHQEMEASENKANDRTEAWLNEMEYERMEEYSNWVNTQTGNILDL